ncbi:MAG: hypothetical protein M1292_06930 [Bacteroidetes bacterium]|nr:hypothetical protein [Bacteroidota bacterium]
MKKIAFITFLFFMSVSCNSGKSKLVGRWQISEFTINNKSLKDPSLSYSDPTDPIRIQFLENGFFILTSNHTDLLLKYLRNDSQAHMYEITSKGKWSVNLFSKIELQFIDTHHELGLLKGKFNLSEGRLTIDAKGDNDFIYFDLRQ